MDADRVQRDLHRGLRGEQLGHADLHVRPLPGVVTARREHDELAGRGQLGHHVGQVVADRLVFPDRLAERLPLLCVPQRVVQGGLADAERAGGDLDPADLQAAHHLPEPLALAPAQQRARRDPVVLEGELAALHALVAELGQVTGDGEAGTWFGQQDADAGVRGPGVRVGLDQQRGQPGPARVGDPHLGPVDDVIRTVPACHRPHGLQVGAAARLGQRHRGAQLAGGHPRQVGVLLLVGAVRQQQLRHHRVPAHRPGQAHPAAGQLLGDPRVAGRADLGVSPRLGDGQAVDAELLHLLDELVRVGVGVLEVAHHGPDLAVDEVPDEPDHGPLVLVQLVDGPKHFEGAPHRPFGIVLVGYGGAEHGHDGIADELLHRPAMPLDGPAQTDEV